MAYPRLKIEQEEEGQQKRAKRYRKTRVFGVASLGWLSAPRLWEQPEAPPGCRIPIWLSTFGTEAEARAFNANLKSHKTASDRHQRLRLPAKVRYLWTSQKVPGGVITTTYLPELFHLDPCRFSLSASDEAPIRFVFAPARWWLERQAAALWQDFAEDALEAARAALFAAYLDRRTSLPLLQDLGFHLALYRSALAQPWVKPAAAPYLEAELLRSSEEPPLGLDAPLAVSVAPADLEAFLTAETQLYYREEIRHGKTQLPSTGRLLPYTPVPAAQLCLDLAVA